MLRNGFTLIELSIVLVIIGLIAGGVLVGQDLVRAAGIRAQITQIEKFNTGVRTFQGKYGFLPGDLPDPYATNFGFVGGRGNGGQGTGNGDGIIAGSDCNTPACDNGTMQAAGETAMLWMDLSKAGLIEGSFTTATPGSPPGADVTGSTLNAYLPQGKIGHGSYIYVWTGFNAVGYFGINYFGISAVTKLDITNFYGKPVSTPGLTVQEAYNIDKKMDDGYPQTGNVTSVYVYNDPMWPDFTDVVYSPPPTGATPGSALTCYDNGSVNGGTQKYSLAQNSGNGLNCGLSFRFQ